MHYSFGDNTCIAAMLCSACAWPVWRCWTALSAMQFPVVSCLSRLLCTSASSEQTIHPEFFSASPPAAATATGAAADSRGPDRICARRCSSSATLRLAAEKTVALDSFFESPITRAGCHCTPVPDCIGRRSVARIQPQYSVPTMSTQQIRMESVNGRCCDTSDR